MTITSKLWKEFVGKKVRLIIKDLPWPKPKDGIFLDVDSTHVFLEISNKNVPFERHDIKRMELKDGE